MATCTRRALLAAATGLVVAPVRAEQPLQLRGRGRLYWLGLAVYDAVLYTGEAFDPAHFAAAPLRLELTYHRKLSRQGIVDRSMQEMARGGPLPPGRQEAWRAFLAQAIPDVTPGQRLASTWLPAQRSTQLLRRQDPEHAHELVDAEFGPRFLGIWLAPHSSAPELRRQLLGLG